MEVSLLEAQGLPDGCALFVRVGAVQQQAPAKPCKLWFPTVPRQASPLINVDVFEPLGGMVMEVKRGTECYSAGLKPLDPEAPPGLKPLEPGAPPGGALGRLKFHVREAAKPLDSCTGGSTVQHLAQFADSAYFQEHGLVAWVRDLFQDLAATRPDDPWAHIRDYSGHGMRQDALAKEPDASMAQHGDAKEHQPVDRCEALPPRNGEPKATAEGQLGSNADTVPGSIEQLRRRAGALLRDRAQQAESQRSLRTAASAEDLRVRARTFLQRRACTRAVLEQAVDPDGAREMARTAACASGGAPAIDLDEAKERTRVMFEMMLKGKPHQGELSANVIESVLLAPAAMPPHAGRKQRSSTPQRPAAEQDRAHARGHRADDEPRKAKPQQLVKHITNNFVAGGCSQAGTDEGLRGAPPELRGQPAGAEDAGDPAAAGAHDTPAGSFDPMGSGSWGLSESIAGGGGESAASRGTLDFSSSTHDSWLEEAKQVHVRAALETMLSKEVDPAVGSSGDQGAKGHGTLKEPAVAPSNWGADAKAAEATRGCTGAAPVDGLTPTRDAAADEPEIESIRDHGQSGAAEGPASKSSGALCGHSEAHAPGRSRRGRVAAPGESMPVALEKYQGGACGKKKRSYTDNALLPMVVPPTLEVAPPALELQHPGLSPASPSKHWRPKSSSGASRASSKTCSTRSNTTLMQSWSVPDFLSSAGSWKSTGRMSAEPGARIQVGEGPCMSSTSSPLSLRSFGAASSPGCARSISVRGSLLAPSRDMGKTFSQLKPLPPFIPPLRLDKIPERIREVEEREKLESLQAKARQKGFDDAVAEADRAAHEPDAKNDLLRAQLQKLLCTGP